jgi:hypothetical protein
VEASSPPFRRTFLRLIGFLRPYRRSLALSILLAVGSQAAGMSIPWLIGDVIDDAIPGRTLRSSLSWWDWWRSPVS